MASIWLIVRTTFYRKGLKYIHGFTTMDRTEVGKIIATVNIKTHEVKYRDKRAETDEGAQRIIKEFLTNLTLVQDFGKRGTNKNTNAAKYLLFSLPGGKVDPVEPTDISTLIRETHETKI